MVKIWTEVWQHVRNWPLYYYY